MTIKTWKLSKLHLNEILFYIYSFLCIWGIRDRNSSNETIYIVTIAMVAIAVFLNVSSLNRVYSINKLLAGISIVYFCTYLYGLVLGIILGNNVRFAVRNFAGMAMYLVAIFLPMLKFQTEDIVKLLQFICIAVSIFAPIAFFIVFRIGGSIGFSFNHTILLNSYSTGQQGTIFTLYYGASNLMFVGYAYGLYKLVLGKRIKLKYVTVCVYEAVVAILLTRSGGMALELLMLTVIEFLCLIRAKHDTRRMLFMLIAVVVATILFTAGFHIIYEIFSPKDGGNISRYSQINYIMGNLSLLGHGLGATYSSFGNIYAVEIIYLDLVYKLGVFALPVFAVYIYTYIQCIRLLLHTKGEWTDVIPLALMGYLWFSFGNPNLFSAGNIIVHIFALTLIYSKKKEKWGFISAYEKKDIVDRNKFRRLRG